MYLPLDSGSFPYNHYTQHAIHSRWMLYLIVDLGFGSVVIARWNNRSGPPSYGYTKLP